MLQDKTTISPDRVAGDVPEVHLLQLWRSLLSTTGRRSDGFARLCCVGQPVHGVLGRACTQHCPSNSHDFGRGIVMTPAVLWRRVLLRHTYSTSTACDLPLSSPWKPRRTEHSRSWTDISIEGWRQPGDHGLQKAHQHRTVRGLSIPPSPLVTPAPTFALPLLCNRKE